METLELLPVRKAEVLPAETTVSTSSPFIEANTIPVTLDEIRNTHIIPTYRNNDRLISIAEFIDTCTMVVKNLFPDEIILEPNIRLSHAVRGRIPEAKNKRAEELEEWETTLFYQRCAFVIEIPSLQTDVGGNPLSFSIAGIKSYENDNVNGKENSSEHFSFCIGYLNKICSNGVFWNDGYSKLVSVKNLSELHALMHNLFESYNASYHLHHLRRLTELEISEREFAQIVGKARMYNHLPNEMKSTIKPLLLGDSQLNTVVRDYYKNESFCRQENGNINLWRLYNLFTGAVKSSYIDSYLDRNVNAYHFVESVRWAIESKSHNWFMN